MLQGISIDWRYQSAALPPGVMTDMPFQLDALGLYQVLPPCHFLFNNTSTESCNTSAVMVKGIGPGKSRAQELERGAYMWEC